MNALKLMLAHCEPTERRKIRGWLKSKEEIKNLDGPEIMHRSCSSICLYLFALPSIRALPRPEWFRLQKPQCIKLKLEFFPSTFALMAVDLIYRIEGLEAFLFYCPVAGPNSGQ
jgi:hypothetical protein